MAAMLFGISPTDPSVLVGVSVVLSAMVTIACVIPALRASRLDPLSTLRSD